MYRYLWILLWLFPYFSFAATAQFQAGKEYEVIPYSQLSHEDQQNFARKINVIEFFSYGCPACYRLEPTLSAWLKKHERAIDFQRVPVIFKTQWEIYARAYFIAHAFNMDNQLNDSFFKAIHGEENKLKTVDDLEKIFTRQGIKAEDFKRAYTISPVVDADLANAKRLADVYQIDHIPTFVIAGKYKTDIERVGGDAEQLMNVINFLIKKAKSTH